MSPIESLTDVLSNYRQHRNPGSSGRGDSHRGLRLLKNLDEDRLNEVSARVLSRSYENRKVVSAMFDMAEDVESILRLNITWVERYA